MKKMTIRFFEGEDAPQSGRRIILPDDSIGNKTVLNPKLGYTARAFSSDFQDAIDCERTKGRRRWAQLLVELDAMELAFWLPEELEEYCRVFAMVPFPSAKTLLRSTPDSLELNRHWLSRLPKHAKSKKFRDHFLRYVASQPKALEEFYSFYHRPLSKRSKAL